jgi:hypothetical protein
LIGEQTLMNAVLGYTEQISWLLFHEYLDDLEQFPDRTFERCGRRAAPY